MVLPFLWYFHDIQLFQRIIFRRKANISETSDILLPLEAKIMEIYSDFPIKLLIAKLQTKTML